MKFFDKLNEVVETVTSKSEEIIEINKLKLKISNLKGKRKERLYLLGTDYYELSQDNEFSPEKVEGLVLDITNLDKDIAELENKIKQLQEVGVIKVKPNCPNCGEDVPSGSKFCPNCGKSLGGKNPEEDPIIDEEEPK